MNGWRMLFYKEVLRFWKVAFQTVAAPVLNPQACKDDMGRLRVAAASTVGDAGFERSQALIEAGVDMVTEGYTGIKKIKFITRTSEGIHTVACEANDTAKELKLSFSIHAEAANDVTGAAA